MKDSHIPEYIPRKKSTVNFVIEDSRSDYSDDNDEDKFDRVKRPMGGGRIFKLSKS